MQKSLDDGLVHLDQTTFTYSGRGFRFHLVRISGSETAWILQADNIYSVERWTIDVDDGKFYISDDTETFELNEKNFAAILERIL